MKTLPITKTLTVLTILGLLSSCGNNKRNTESKTTTKTAGNSIHSVTTTKTPSNKIYKEFKIDYSLQGKMLSISLKTDLPNNIKVWVTVSRSYWEKGDTSEYLFNYMSEQSAIGVWEKSYKILIDDKKWKSDFAKRREKLSEAGLGFDVDRISNSIQIDAYVPITNQPYPKFKKKGIIEDDIRIHLPIVGKVVKESKYGNYQSLKKGKTYSVSKTTPLMPEFNPSDPINAINHMKELPIGSRITILLIKNKRDTPWYEVNATDKEGNEIGNGWINSIALIGQKLLVVKK